jgi:hypothetical protein
MFNAAIYGQGVPQHLSTDHDPLFEAHRWQANLRILEIDELKTVPYVPCSHPFVERLIGTIRREFLGAPGEAGRFQRMQFPPRQGERAAPPGIEPWAHGGNDMG